MRNPKLTTFLPAVLMVLGACSDSGTGPSTEFETIAGTYVGELYGLSEGIALGAEFTLTIIQAQGSLSGSYGMTGALTDGIDTVPVQGTGTINGTIDSGKNPSVNLTLRVGGCPNQPESFSGAYDSVNRRLTISGPVNIYSETCAVLLSYPMTILLTR